MKRLIESVLGPNVNRRRRQREERNLVFASESFTNNLLEINKDKK